MNRRGIEHIKNSYFSSIRKENINPLSKEEEKNLFVLYRTTNDIKYRDIILKSNLRYVINCVSKFKLDAELYQDLIEEGNLGLAHAIELYDYDSNARFLSYARHWIKKYILEFIKNNTTIKNSKNIISLNTEYTSGNDDSNLKMSDTIEDVNSISPESMFNKINIDVLLCNLDQRNKTFVELYFGLNNNEKMSVEEIRKFYGKKLSNERIRKIIHESLAIMRKKLLSANNMDDILYHP